ncbi:hypothetical protein NQ315_006112, partial [Exocentrus adspersus]
TSKMIVDGILHIIHVLEDLNDAEEQAEHPNRTFYRRENAFNLSNDKFIKLFRLPKNNKAPEADYPLLNRDSKLNLENKLLLIKAVVQPQLTYAATAWGHSCKTHLNKLQAVENIALALPGSDVKRPLTDEELLQLMESGVSDIEFMSDEDDNVGDGGSDLGDETGGEDLEMSQIEKDDPSKELDEEIETIIRRFLKGKLIHHLKNGVIQQKKSEKRGTKRKLPSEKDIRVENFIKEHNLTTKKHIVWRQNITYISPQINWHNEIVANATVELPSPMYFFQEYFTADLFRLMAQQIYTRFNKIVNSCLRQLKK